MEAVLWFLGLMTIAVIIVWLVRMCIHWRSEYEKEFWDGENICTTLKYMCISSKLPCSRRRNEARGQNAEGTDAKLTCEESVKEERQCSLLTITNDISNCEQSRKNSRRGSQIQLKPSELNELLTSDDVKASMWCQESDSGDSIKTNSSFVTCDEGDSHVTPSSSHTSGFYDLQNVNVSIIG